MNPNAILALISDLYAQIIAAQDRIAVLEEELRHARADTSESDDSLRSVPTA